MFKNGTTAEEFKKAIPGYSKSFNEMLRFFVANGYKASEAVQYSEDPTADVQSVCGKEERDCRWFVPGREPGKSPGGPTDETPEGGGQEEVVNRR